jgi:hypothetical protein
VNYGSDYPKPRLVRGEWLVPYAITSTADEDGVVTYEAKEAASKTLFAHDLNAVVPAGHDADVLEAIKHGIRLQRAAEYPPASDYLDGVAKDDADQIAAYKAVCLAVKAKYPFPDA